MTHIATLQQDALGLSRFQLELERVLRRWLEVPDEARIDPLWSNARSLVSEYALRPAKRVRPTLLAAGYAVATGRVDTDAIVDFGVGLELLHAFMLVHDDVADRALTRRGGPSLHLSMGGDRVGESLAIVSGDHLYARALEAMLAAASPGALKATRYMLEICRHTAAGQHLDLVLTHTPLSQVSLRQAVRVARLKTAKYGFVAPLVCGAMLGGASPDVVRQLDRIGWDTGLAYQLRDDVLGLFGDIHLAGKDGGGDYLEGKRTFPVLAAWARATPEGRARLEQLWAAPHPGSLEDARAEVIRFGGLDATQRVVKKATSFARARVARLPKTAATPLLDQLLASMVGRVS